mgnify:FL=1
MTPIVCRWVEAILSTDVDATDAELVQRFMREGGASRDKATEWVSHRRLYQGERVWDRRIV